MKSFFLTRLPFIFCGGIVALFLLGYFYPVGVAFGRMALLGLLLAIGFDLLALYRYRHGVSANRSVAEKLSNGDENPIHIQVTNHYPFTVQLEVVDELPVQFQLRDFVTCLELAPGQTGDIRFTVRPVERGEYYFGDINIFVTGPLGFGQRRYQILQQKMAPVYPSYIQMRQYELSAISNRLSESGIKRVRRLGHTMEFDHLRRYVRGDDYRTINWKATARRTQPMVNQFQDEKSQLVYSVIDKGRVMKMPFEGMTLLDYAINASLVISNIAIRKQDRAGLVTFSHEMGTLVPAERKPAQMFKIQEALYNQKTQFLESNFETLLATILRRLRQRSLILLYTNFETLFAMRRQLPYLRRLARFHLVVVIFFENTELRQIYRKPALSLEDIYIKTIAEKFAYEKKLIVKELQQHGLHAILTPPQQLTVQTIGKYLELKARGLI